MYVNIEPLVTSNINTRRTSLRTISDLSSVSELTRLYDEKRFQNNIVTIVNWCIEDKMNDTLDNIINFAIDVAIACENNDSFTIELQKRANNYKETPNYPEYDRASLNDFIKFSKKRVSYTDEEHRKIYEYYRDEKIVNK